MNGSYESLIGEAVFGDVSAANLAIAKASVKFAVQTAMFCRCGTILDQRTATLIEDGDTEQALMVVCPNHAKRLREIRARMHEEGKDLKPIRLVTWEGVEVLS